MIGGHVTISNKQSYKRIVANDRVKTRPRFAQLTTVFEGKKKNVAVNKIIE